MDALDLTDMSRLVDLSLALKFLVAVICGGAVGMERETTGKPAGLRTCILVCLGSTFFTLAGMEMARQFGGDATRLAAQIVTGIGFLGAGVILHSRNAEVRGVTTAALIWLVAALGVMIGAGYLIAAVAVAGASVATILALRPFERAMRRRRSRVYRLVIAPSTEVRAKVATILELHDDDLSDITFEQPNTNEVVVTFRYFGTERQRRELVGSLLALEGVHGHAMATISAAV